MADLGPFSGLVLRLLGLPAAARVDSVISGAWELAAPWATAGLTVAAVGLLALAAVNFLPAINLRLRTRILVALIRLAAGAVLLVIAQRLELNLRLRLERPQNWVAVVDDSASMRTRDAANGNAQSRFQAAAADLERLRNRAGKRVELLTRTVSGQPLGEEAGAGPTNLHHALTEAALRTHGVNRVVLLTDGRDTANHDLAGLGQSLRARGVHLDILPYGGGAPPRDSAIVGQPERAVIRLGEDLIVNGEIRQSAAGTAPAAETRWQVSLEEDGRVVHQIEADGGPRAAFRLAYKPPRGGPHTYTLVLAGDDTLAANNRYTFRAAVVEEKINVLLVEGYPGYEFKLMKYVLETDPLVNLVAVSHIPGGGVYVQGNAIHANPEEGVISSQAELFKYDIVVLRDVSRRYFLAGGDVSESRLQAIVQFVVKRGGGLIVTGGQDVFRAGGYEDSALMEVLPFDLGTHFSKEPQFDGLFFANTPKAAAAHPLLRLFDDPDKNRDRLTSLRELNGSNNVGRFRPLATPLMTRFVKLKGASGEPVEREVPLMAYMAVGEGKVLAWAADTLWRWQLQPEFDDPPLQGLLANAVRYLAPPPQQRAGIPFVALADPSPQVGQEVLLSTVLKDKNFDPIAKADLLVTVTRPDGRQEHIYPRDLPEAPGRYEYRVAVAMPGNHQVRAEYAGQVHEAAFYAEGAASEFADLSANRAAMEELAEAAGGTCVGSVDDWLRTLDTSPSTYELAHNLQAWNSPLALLLFFALVCLDCYLRKRQGLP
ncbi:MAG: hypothetical protein BWZ02_02912 [Lentisphaerae bacterium ADurb.BinA184]|nr:MAG: hypothetical protein BWZ02_02912 [Lentisphaerae bacterium ADurb.BinA184]